MSLPPVFQQLGLALLLGLLVGMQRERSGSALAGIRTFPLVTVFGTLCGLLAPTMGAWFPAAGLLGVVAGIVVGNLHKLRAGTQDPGLTTEFAMLVMYGVGVYLTVGAPVVAAAVCGGVTLLLHLKPELHEFTHRLGESEVRAIMQFVLIALIVLPILPDTPFGPFRVLNLREIWLMVVLIVGISLVGFLISRFVRPDSGLVLMGVLGGIISSTATSISYARRTRERPDQSRSAALVVMIASTVVYVRVLLAVQVLAPSFVMEAMPRMAVLLAVSAALCAIWWLRLRRIPEPPLDTAGSSELKSALLFGALYAVVLLAVAAARAWMGNRGLYVVAGISGLTDMDAITLSTSRLVETGRLAADVGGRMIVLAAASNLLFKGIMVAVAGDRRMLQDIAILFGASLATAALVLVF